ncbi:MAG TPA: AAA family ATPase [Candidatus Limnocylindrales bacterium]|nr:AAA family ATPase [Candidatus Limnocylindrales bacterium]
MTSPFVGRVAELAEVDRVVRRAARDHSPGAVLIVGEPGTGKSRLLREIAGEGGGMPPISLVGFEPTETIPLAAVGELVRRLAAVPVHGPRLEALVFGATRSRGQGALAVFEAASRALAAFGPLVLVIDDLQWIDPQSLALIHYLLDASESRTRPFVVIAGSRPSSAATTFRSGIAGRLPDARRAWIELRGLSIDEGVTLARALDRSLDDRAASVVWQRAKGSPFWVEALALGRGSTDAVDLVTDRLRGLSVDGAETLNALTVAARPIPRRDLAALGDVPIERLGHAIGELVGRGLAIESGGSVRLAHDLIREAAATGIPIETRRRLHARLAEHIESGAGDDLQRLAEAIDHRAAAGLPKSALAVRILGSPTRRLIDGETLRGLASIADSLEPGAPDRIELDVGLGTLAAELGDQHLAIRHWRRAGGATTDAAVRLRAELEAARAAYVLGLAPDVRAHLARARQGVVDPVSAIELDTVEAELELWIEHDTASGAASAARAVAGGRALADGVGGPDRLSVETRQAFVAALEAATDAALQQERADDVLRLGEEALAVAGSLGDEARLGALLRSAFAYRTLGLWRESAAWYREAWEISQRLILPISMIEAGLGYARVLHGLGRLDEARAVAEDTNALESRIRPWRRWDTSKAVLHEIEVSRGDPGALAKLQADATEVDPHFAITLHLFAATWIARQDGGRRAEAVERELAAARESSTLAGCPRCAREVRVVAAEALARIGRVDEAEAELATWERAYEGPEYVARSLWRTRAQAAIAMELGDAGALTALTALIDAFDAAGKLEEATWARLDAGRVLRESGDRAAAITILSRAADDAERAGAEGLGRVVRRALRELGVRAWRRGATRRGRDAFAELTGREREVAELAAGGASNREIADALVLSPKTVERHLTNILAKAGARNRTELSSRILAGRVRESPDDEDVARA